VHTPFSQAPDKQMFPQDPQFWGLVDVFAVQSGVVEKVGDVGKEVEDAEKLEFE
jgi:hypothetical protein